MCEDRKAWKVRVVETSRFKKILKKNLKHNQNFHNFIRFEPRLNTFLKFYNKQFFFEKFERFLKNYFQAILFYPNFSISRALVRL